MKNYMMIGLLCIMQMKICCMHENHNQNRAQQLAMGLRVAVSERLHEKPVQTLEGELNRLIADQNYLKRIIFEKGDSYDKNRIPEIRSVNTCCGLFAQPTLAQSVALENEDLAILRSIVIDIAGRLTEKNQAGFGGDEGILLELQRIVNSRLHEDSAQTLEEELNLLVADQNFFKRIIVQFGSSFDISSIPQVTTPISCCGLFTQPTLAQSIALENQNLARLRGVVRDIVCTLQSNIQKKAAFEKKK